MKPAARRAGLVVRELPDETVVYDLDRHQAHCLNRTAAIVFRGADGTRGVEELGVLLGGDVDREARESVVRTALDQLAAAHLLDPAPSLPGHVESPSRRAVLRRAGLGAALLLPAVVSVLAPTPAEAAATCLTNCSNPLDEGKPCNCSGAPGPGCPGVCQTGGICSDIGTTCP
jgi:hypothetical protein